MARRLISFPARSEGGPVVGGSGTEVRFYQDSTLTTLATLYAASTGAPTIPNPRTPNAGRSTALLADRLSTDAFITVVDITSFAVGDQIPIYNGSSTVHRCITVITAGTRRFDLEAALGIAFLASNTTIGGLDTKGHIYAWVDDSVQHYAQSKNVASSRVLPPVQIPTQVAGSSIAVTDEGTAVSSRVTVNFIGTAVKVVDNAGSNRLDVTISDRVYLAGVL